MQMRAFVKLWKYDKWKFIPSSSREHRQALPSSLEQRPSAVEQPDDVSNSNLPAASSSTDRKLARRISRSCPRLGADRTVPTGRRIPISIYRSVYIYSVLLVSLEDTPRLLFVGPLLWASLRACEGEIERYWRIEVFGGGRIIGDLWGTTWVFLVVIINVGRGMSFYC